MQLIHNAKMYRLCLEIGVLWPIHVALDDKEAKFRIQNIWIKFFRGILTFTRMFNGTKNLCQFSWKSSINMSNMILNFVLPCSTSWKFPILQYLCLLQVSQRLGKLWNLCQTPEAFSLKDKLFKYVNRNLNYTNEFLWC